MVEPSEGHQTGRSLCLGPWSEGSVAGSAHSQCSRNPASKLSVQSQALRPARRGSDEDGVVMR
jgi:hypothetical protein